VAKGQCESFDFFMDFRRVSRVFLRFWKPTCLSVSNCCLFGTLQSADPASFSADGMTEQWAASCRRPRVHSLGEHVDKMRLQRFRIPCPVLTGRNEPTIEGFLPAGATPMLMTKERRPTIRTLRGWAISVLQDAGAIRECEEHGWMQDRADPHARVRAFDIARQDPPRGVSAQAAAVAIAEVLDGIGDACPECTPEDQ
jgi:hypothetical protein